MKFLFVLLSLAIALPTHEQSLEAVRKLWFSKQAFVQKITTQGNRRKFHTLTAEEDCLMAQQNLNSLAATCLSTVGGIFGNGTSDSNMTSEEVTTAISTYCTTGGCHAQMETAAQNVIEKCAAVWKTGCASASPCDNTTYPCAPGEGGTCGVDVQHLRDLRMILNLFCVKAPGADGTDKFCVPSFYKFVKDDTQDLQTRLTNGCDLCTLKIFTIWSQIEPFEAAIHFLNLGTVCLKRDNKFCAIHKQQLDEADATWGAQCNNYTESAACGAATRGCRWNDNKCEDDWTGTKGAAKTDLICHQCTAAYIRRLVILIDLADHFGLPEDPRAPAPRAVVKNGLRLILFFQSGVCSSDLTGKLCLPQLQTQTANFTAEPCNALAEVKQNTGCCAATVLGFAVTSCQIATLFDSANTCMNDVQTMRLGLLACATVHNPPVVLGATCAEQKWALAVKLVIAGLDTAWAAVPANRLKLFLIIKRIVAFNGGVDDGNVTVTVDATSRRLLADGTLVVNAGLSVDNSPQADAAMTGLAVGSNIETLDLSSGVPAAGLGTITVQSQGVSNTVTTTSGSAAVAAGFVSSALLAAVCLTM